MSTLALSRAFVHSLTRLYQHVTFNVCLLGGPLLRICNFPEIGE